MIEMGRARNLTQATAATGFEMFGRRGVGENAETARRDETADMFALVAQVKSLPEFSVELDTDALISSDINPSKPHYVSLVSAVAERMRNPIASGVTARLCTALIRCRDRGEAPGPLLFDALRASLGARSPSAQEAQDMMRVLLSGTPDEEQDEQLHRLAAKLGDRLVADGRYASLLMQNPSTGTEGEDERHRLEGPVSACALSMMSAPLHRENVVGPVAEALRQLDSEQLVEDHRIFTAIRLGLESRPD